MKMLIIGAGGVGSYLLDELCKCYLQEQIDSFHFQITIADNDTVEVKQIEPGGYQNFTIDDVGKNKARVLADRFNLFGVKAIQHRITKDSELKQYGLIVMAVDNEKTREMVVRYCFIHDMPFIDLSATGRTIHAIPMQEKLEDNLKLIDTADKKEYGCQDREDLKKGWIQKGNKIVAMIGVQMILNHIRGHNNRIIKMVV